MTAGRARFVSIILAAFASAFAGVARADDADASKPRLSNEARAEQLFRSGEKKFDSGAHAEACVDFAESLKLGPKLGTLLNLALCHETVGKLATAWREFQHGAAWASQNNQRDRLEFAVQHIRGIEPRLPRVVLHLPADRAVSAIDLDGEPLPEQSWYLPLYLDNGEHHLAVMAPGKTRQTVSFRVTDATGDQIVAVPRLADDPNAEPVPDQPGAPPSDGAKTAGYVLLSAGAVGILAGGVTGVLAMTTDSGDSALKDYATISTVSFLAGAGLAAAGGVLVLSATRHTAVAVSPRAGGASLGISGTF